MILGQLAWFVRTKVPASKVSSAVEAVFRTDLAIKTSAGRSASPAGKTGCRAVRKIGMGIRRFAELPQIPVPEGSDCADCQIPKLRRLSLRK